MFPANTDNTGTTTHLTTKKNTDYALPVQTQHNATNSPHELHSNMASSIPGHCFVPVKST